MSYRNARGNGRARGRGRGGGRRPAARGRAAGHRVPGLATVFPSAFDPDAFLGCLKFVKNLAGVEEWPAGKTLSLSPDITSFDDLTPQIAFSRKGLVEYLWMVGKASQSPPDAGESPSDWLTRLNIPVDNISSEPYEPTSATVLMVLMFNTQGSKRTNTPSLVTQSKIPGVDDLEKFYLHVGHWNKMEWAGKLLGEQLFSKPQVGLFLANMGEMRDAWILTHSAAGSSAFRRIRLLCEMLRVDVPLFVKVFEQRAAHGMCFMYGISYQGNSFAEMELEGRCVASIMGLAVSRITTKRRWAKTYEQVVGAFKAALVGLSPAECRTSPFALTLPNADARVGFSKKIDKGILLLRTKGSQAEFRTELRSMNSDLCIWKTDSNWNSKMKLMTKMDFPDHDAAHKHIIDESIKAMSVRPGSELTTDRLAGKTGAQMVDEWKSIFTTSATESIYWNDFAQESCISKMLRR
jgi:hypothetical protein